MKFQINNTFRLYKFGTVLGYVMAVFILALVLSLRFFPDYFGFMFGIVWIIVFIYSVSYVILIRKKYDLEYDGHSIRYKSDSGEKTIDLMKVRSVKYGVQKGYPTRGRRSYIYLEFEGYDSSEKPVRIYDHVYEREIGRLMSGEHSGYPLLLMYDDIIARYPEKR